MSLMPSTNPSGKTGRSSGLRELRAISEKIAAELVFAEEGKDGGLLPVNSLLNQVEELAAAPGLEALAQAAKEGRLCVDSILDSTGTFSSASLDWLRQWASWWQAALDAIEAQGAPEPLLQSWKSGAAELALASPPSVPLETANPSAGEPRLVLNLEQDAELLGEFINEAQEHLQNIEQGVLVLEDHPSDEDTLNAIFRAFHTFKGGSGFLNLTPIQTLAHDLESLLDLARQQKLKVTPEVTSLILEGGDTLKRFVSEIGSCIAGKNSREPLVIPISNLLSKIRMTLAAAASAPVLALEPKLPCPESPVPGAELPAVTAVPQPPASDRIEPAAASSRPHPAGTAVKVDTQKLDSLVDLVGEMVIAQSMVVQNRDLTSVQSARLARDLAQLGRITKDLQRTVMSLRMVPIRTLFQKMQRLVRDVSGKVGKPVQLVTEGEETELDRTIVEELSDPLVHMIRNSIDHGIEAADVRLAHGKPAHGTLTLKAFHQGGNIIVEIHDDGKGLDRERILAKALDQGLVQPDQPLTDSQIFNLILQPGFSTAEKITDLSGRGVGMDVVRRNVEKLRGKLEMQSVPGTGSTFRIYLPLTLAIIDGLLVGIGEQCYILPTLLVRESFRPAPDMIRTVSGRGEMINVRGRLQPLLRLYEHLRVQPVSTDPAQSIVLVLEAGADARCVLVDKLLGKQEVVIKSLGETFRQTRSLAGAAILGDGRVGLILDPDALVRLESTPLRHAA